MRRRTDQWLRGVAGAGALVAVTTCGLVTAYVIAGACPALQSVGLVRFMTDAGWHPTPGADGQFSMAASIVGTASVALVAVAIAAPVAIGAAIGAQMVVPRAARWALDAGVGVLAGMPSVVLGLWGLTVLVPRMAAIRAPGTGLLAAGATLAIMIVPTVYIASKSAIAAVPRALLSAAAAMGLSRWATIRAVITPVAGRSVLVGVALGTLRAVGETMVVVMVAGNVAAIPRSLFDPVRTLTANVALEMGYATGTHRSALFLGGAVVLLGSAVTAVLLRRHRTELGRE